MPLPGVSCMLCTLAAVSRTPYCTVFTCSKISPLCRASSEKSSAAMDLGPPLGEGDLPGVIDLLKHSLSHHPDVQKQAERGLASLEQRPGFCSCMAVRAALVGSLVAVHMHLGCESRRSDRHETPPP
jgi:hypothetical protein